MCLYNFVLTVTLPLPKGWDAKSKPWTGPQHETRDGSLRFIDAPDSSVQLVDGDPASGQCREACHTPQSAGTKRTWPSETAQGPVDTDEVLLWRSWYSEDTVPSSVLMHSIFRHISPVIVRMPQIEIWSRTCQTHQMGKRESNNLKPVA